MNPSVSIKYGNLELRGRMDTFMKDPPIYTQEIVYWVHPENNKQYCYTVAYWKHNSEGMYLTYVNNRPTTLSTIDQNYFMKLTIIGQRIADDIYAHQTVQPYFPPAVQP